jgi:hypothetical protein
VLCVCVHLSIYLSAYLYAGLDIPVHTHAHTHTHTHTHTHQRTCIRAHTHTADGHGQLRLEPPQNKAGAVLDEGFGGGIELMFRQLLREDSPCTCKPKL